MRRPRGAARLEFALTVIVVGVLIALALTRLAPLQAFADDAVQRTQAAQRSATHALAATRCPAVSSASNPVSCPSPTSQGVSP